MTTAEFKTKLQAANSLNELDLLMIQHWPEVFGAFDEMRELQFAVMARYESLSCRGCEGHNGICHESQEAAA
jgi:hypothetical protein